MLIGANKANWGYLELIKLIGVNKVNLSQLGLFGANEANLS